MATEPKGPHTPAPPYTAPEKLDPAKNNELTKPHPADQPVPRVTPIEEEDTGRE